MLSSIERHSCSSAAYSIDKSTGCCYQWHGSSTVDKIFWSRYLLVNSYKNISTSSVPSSFLATVCKSMWSLTNTKELHERRASAKGNIHWPQNANQRSCHSSTKTMRKVSCKSKKKVWLELFSSACFISTIGL